MVLSSELEPGLVSQAELPMASALGARGRIHYLFGPGALWMAMVFPVHCLEGVDGDWGLPLSPSSALVLASIWLEEPARHCH